MRPYYPKALRYIEPDPTDEKYKGCIIRMCTHCGRMLPLCADFFAVHTVKSPTGKKYQYRRPDCKKCRQDERREYIMSRKRDAE